MTFWHRFNTRVYRAWYRLRHRRVRSRVTPRAASDPAVLYVAWGRIGDTVLSTGILQHLRGVFEGCRIVCAGRPEVSVVVEPFVDEFVPFDEEERLARPYECILSDIHLFYGGTARLGSLIEALPAKRKFAYEGYYLGAGLAPVRRYPRGVEVIPALSKPCEFERLHVLFDYAHYFREVTRRWSGEAFAGDDLRPSLVARTASASDCIAWQPVSNNRKKDYPLARWREVLEAFPDTTFVALGSAKEREALQGFAAPNVENRCGVTDLEEAMATIAGARGFLGLDSGLTHVAACLGRPTVCVCQSSNLGYFFPYPPECGRENLHTVAHPDYRACSGCFMTCHHESIFATYRKGSKCLRELPAARVIEAVRERLEAPACVAIGC
ncbi:MAG: glycosyltransferase family 9 protein [Planctomycetota bacterium]